MIGNDIIDLSYARQTSNWQRPRWLEKLFTQAERDVILKSTHPELFTWLLWSMKESVYKVIVQQEHHRFFAPKQLECRLIGQGPLSAEGEVHYRSKIFSTQSSWNEKFIHTLAFPERQLSHFISEVLTLTNAPGSRRCLYQKIIDRYTREAKVPGVAPRIKKNNLGIPRIFTSPTQQSLSLSISHHGRFGAFAFLEC